MSTQSPMMEEPANLKPCFCVGEKTRSYLIESGFEVIDNAQNSEELGELIIKKYTDYRFLLFSGNLSRKELPLKLQEKSINYQEIEVYHTYMNPRKFDRSFDGILFFSPSGVRSFVLENQITGHAFCIGNTTAGEIKKYTGNYKIANKPTIENVLVQAIKQLKKQ